MPPRATHKRIRGLLTWHLLRAIDHGIYGMADLVSAMTAPETSFGASWGKTDRYIRRREEERTRARLDAKERHRLATLIYQLKSAGILKPSPTSDGWLTKKGKEKLAYLQELLFKKKRYGCPKRGPLTLVIFDIPERYRGYRDWIRAVLYTLKFQMLQKSVFAGRIKIPEEFIRDLEQKNMLNHVHIFTLSKRGTLESYVKRYIDGIIEYEI